MYNLRHFKPIKLNSITITLDEKRSFNDLRLWLAVLLTAIIMFGLSSNANAHGGKTHGDDQITSFAALRAATNLYTRLIAGGKLDETWETQLVQVEISTTERDEKTNYIVTFTRSSGSPAAVYFRIKPNGEYAGSNFIKSD